MAAGCVFAKVMCAIGSIAAVALLIIFLAGITVSMYAIRCFYEWNDKG